MEVEFRSRQLRRRFEHEADAQRAWGAEVGRRYIQRIQLLLSAERLVDLYGFRALDLHPLTGDRSGQFAIRINGRMRLIITMTAERAVMIEEVVDYHA